MTMEQPSIGWRDHEKTRSQVHQLRKKVHTHTGAVPAAGAEAGDDRDVEFSNLSMLIPDS